MTNGNRTRQLKGTGVVKDKEKSVTMPTKRCYNIVVPQKGINVGSDWKLGADELNVILYRRRKSKTGKEQWAVDGYYSTIGNALIGLVRHGVRDTELVSVQAVQDKIAQIRVKARCAYWASVRRRVAALQRKFSLGYRQCQYPTHPGRRRVQPP
jgi:hypothetical protein